MLAGHSEHSDEQHAHRQSTQVSNILSIKNAYVVFEHFAIEVDVRAMLGQGSRVMKERVFAA